MPAPARAATRSTAPPSAAPVTLGEVRAAVPGLRAAGPQADETPVAGCTLDSRQVAPGYLYAALPGSRAHGAAFAGAAAEAGAVAVLTDDEGRDRALATGLPVLLAEDARGVLGAVSVCVHRAPAEGLLLLGVTGTNGKTTSSWLVEAGLRGAGLRTGLVGTIETRVADDVVRSVRTTPEAPDLQALFGRMRDAGVQACAMEVSSHALALGRVDGTVFDVAAFTNLSQDHLDFHADLEDYFAAKASLFSPERCRAAVVWTDDPWGLRLARSVAADGAVPLTTVGRGAAPGAAPHWQVRTTSADARGSDLSLEAPDGRSVPAHAPLPGSFNGANAAIALVSLAVAGVDPAVAAEGVARTPGVPGRLERVEVGQPFAALVDYAHTPDAVTTVLAALRPLTPGRLVVVLGCGGDRDHGKRPLMGRAAAEGADLAVLTSDNPRSEDPVAILDAMVAGVRDVPGADVEVVPARAAAIARAVEGLGEGDTVVVAGKGHETGQEVAGVVHPFDDRTVLADAVRAACGAGAA